MRYSEFQRVALRDGRVVTVLDVLHGGDAYLVEEYTPDGESLYEEFVVEPEEILGAS